MLTLYNHATNTNQERVRRHAVGLLSFEWLILLIFSDLFAAVLQRRMRGRQAGDRDTEGRAGNVVVADHVAPLDRIGVAAMFTADAHFQLGAGLAAIVDRHLHQLAHAFPVQGLERILGQDALRQHR